MMFNLSFGIYVSENLTGIDKPGPAVLTLDPALEPGHV